MSAYLENSFKIFALIDTGASHSVISLAQLHHVRLEAHLSPPPFSSAQTTEGSPILGETTVGIRLGRFQARVPVVVVPKLSQDLIPFLQEHNAEINFGRTGLPSTDNFL